jgi:hypothetical protein
MASIVSANVAETLRPKIRNFFLQFSLIIKGGKYMAESYYCEKCNRTMNAD